jgi:hypothetical protein
MNLLARVPLTVLCTGFLLTASDARAGSLDLSEPRSFVCETSAVKLDTEPFEASKGEIVVELQLDDPAKSEGPGRWRAVTSSSEHTSSFAVLTKETCAPDCPFTQAKDGSIQLWSPKPMALTQLDDSMTLVLISLNPTSLEMKASFFKKKQLSGLERGDCKMHEPGASQQGMSEQNPTEQNAGQPSETEQKE